jgi:hypothetical protein
VLEKEYGVPGENDRVNYKLLVEEVETVFTLKVIYFFYLFKGIRERSFNKAK